MRSEQTVQTHIRLLMTRAYMMFSIPSAFLNALLQNKTSSLGQLIQGSHFRVFYLYQLLVDIGNNFPVSSSDAVVVGCGDVNFASSFLVKLWFMIMHRHARHNIPRSSCYFRINETIIDLNQICTFMTYIHKYIRVRNLLTNLYQPQDWTEFNPVLWVVKVCQQI